MPKTMRPCPHYWHIEAKNGYNHGKCEICQEERKFPWDGKGQTTLIKAGKPLDVFMLHQFYERHKNEILNDVKV